MKTKARGFLSAALALVMVLALMVPAVSALDISVGNEFGGGKVTAFEEKTLGTGLTYSKTTFTDAEERNQAMYALEFNPKTSDFMPVVYSPVDGNGRHHTARRPEFGNTIRGRRICRCQRQLL